MDMDEDPGDHGFEDPARWRKKVRTLDDAWVGLGWLLNATVTKHTVTEVELNKINAQHAESIQRKLSQAQEAHSRELRKLKRENSEKMALALQSSNSMSSMNTISEGDEGGDGANAASASANGGGAGARSPAPPQSPHQRMLQEELQGCRQTLEEAESEINMLRAKVREGKGGGAGVGLQPCGRVLPCSTAPLST